MLKEKTMRICILFTDFRTFSLLFRHFRLLIDNISITQSMFSGSKHKHLFITLQEVNLQFKLPENIHIAKLKRIFRIE